MNISAPTRRRSTTSSSSRCAVVVALLITLLVAEPITAAAAPSFQQFAIGYGTTVSDGVPQVGAGNLEVGEASDVYTFDGTAGDAVILDVLSGDAGVFRWHIETPSGVVVRDSALFVDFEMDLTESGTYTVAVAGATPATTGTYAYDLVLVPPAEQFVIGFGDVVSEGVPGPGAGSVDTPGAEDRYAFDGVASQTIVFDHLAGRNVFIGWTLEAPDGTTVFESFIGDRQVVLPLTGAYTLTLRGNGVDDTGTYSFVLLLAPGSEVFSISIGDTVSDGVPATGAGHLEGPGSTDVYSFSGLAGQGVSFEHLAGSNVALGWRLVAPDGAELFDGFLGDREVVLPATGSYSLVVRGNGPADAGTYSFRIVETVINTPPFIEPLFDLVNEESDDVRIELVSGDADGDPLVLTASGLPPGVVVDTTQRVLRGVVASGAATGSPYDVTVTVTDPAGASASTTISWTITAPPSSTTTTSTTSTTSPTTTTIPETTTTTTTTTVPELSTIAARVDIVPPARCIRADLPGLVMVVVYGSAELDVRRIERTSIVLEAMAVATIYGRPLAIRLDLDHDGFDDLVALVQTVAGGIEEGTTTATVSGFLDDRKPFAGDDGVCVIARSCLRRSK